MTVEHQQYLQQAKAEVESVEGFAQMLMATAQKSKVYLDELEKAYKEIDQLKQETKVINNTFTASVGMVVESVEQLTAPCQPSVLPTTSMPRLDSTSTT